MKNFLTVSTGTSGSAVAAERVLPITGQSPAQSRVRQNLGGLVQAYKALPMAQKGGWQHVVNTLNSQQNRAGRSKMTPANAFVTLNNAILAIGGDILSDAPTDLSAPPVLPAITVQAHNVANVFTLKLDAGVYENSICIFAAPPMPAGKNTFPDNAFKTIGFVTVLAPGAVNDLTAMYKAAFGTPEPGAQIGVKLVATSNTGIRLSPLLVTGVVKSTAGDSAHPAKNPACISHRSFDNKAPAMNGRGLFPV